MFKEGIETAGKGLVFDYVNHISLLSPHTSAAIYDVQEVDLYVQTPSYLQEANSEAIEATHIYDTTKWIWLTTISSGSWGRVMAVQYADIAEVIILEHGSISTPCFFIFINFDRSSANSSVTHRHIPTTEVSKNLC
jgi:hypothetical protein